MENVSKKPKLKLTGTDGNAYAVLAAARKAAQKGGWSDSEIKSMLDRATSGDYSNLLATICEHFDVR